MTCEEVQERLPAWLDGAVGAGAGADLAAHVGGCLQCAAEVSALRRLQGELDDLLAPGAPPPLAFASLSRRIEQEEAPVSTDGLRRTAGRRASGQPSRRWHGSARRVSGVLARGRWLGVGSAMAAAAALFLFSQGPKSPVERRSKAPRPVEVELVDPVAHVEEAPEELRKRAALFLDYPIVVRLDQLQTLEAVLADPGAREGRG